MPGFQKRLGIAVAAAVAVAALVVVGIGFASTRPVTEPVRLADGTQVRIRSVAVGRELYSPYEAPFARLVAKLPVPLRSAVGRVLPPAMPAWTGQTALGLWIESDPTPTTVPSKSRRESEYLVFLNDGRPFRINSIQQAKTRLRDGRHVEGHFFPVPPATIGKIAVSLYPRHESGRNEPEEQTPQATWILRPRLRPPSTNWIGTPLPQRQTSEGLEAVLTTLMVNADWVQLGRAPTRAPDFLRAVPFARFELLHLGRPATNWQVECVSYLGDEWGGGFGHHGAFGNSGSWMRGPNYVQWRSPLWPGQVWKLGVEFTRVSGFSNTEQVTFTNLVPGVLLTNSLSTVHGTVAMKRISSSQEISPGIDLEMEFQPRRLPARLTLLSATDSHGTPVEGFRSACGDTDSTFTLMKTSSTNGPFTATFALQLGRVLEFTAEPEVGITPPSNHSPAAAR